MAKKKQKEHPVYLKALAQKREGKQVYLDTCDVAKLIRTALASKWPETKFSVRSDKYRGGSSIDVRWTDGPRQRDVEQVIKRYSFAAFDGSIDMKIYTDNWLMPDGSMAAAYSPGTTGSSGTLRGYATDAPHPQAVLIESGGPDYVFAHRDLSPAKKREVAIKAAERWGYKGKLFDANGEPMMNSLIEIGPSHFEYLSTLIHREESGFYDPIPSGA